MSAMTSETNIFSFSFSEISDPLERARAALRAMRQYQQDWEEYGVDRVHKYFDDVEGDWLENFESISLPTNEPTKSDSDIIFLDVYQKLQSLGLSKSFIQNVVFPSWWKNEFEDDQCAICKLLKYIADRLLLKIDYLVESSTISLEFLPVFTKFKLQKNQENPNLFAYLARSVAKATVLNIGSFYKPIEESSALAIRQSILENYTFVSLDSLLGFCWKAGIPVVHFDQRPKGQVKSDGLVVIVEGRPVIIIGSSRKQSAWLLFILAHELGHIVNGDLQDGVLVDTNFSGGVIDQEEEDANEFARKLLFGDSPLQWDGWLSKNSLLDTAKELSRIYCLDVGSVVLNYAWQTGDWKCAMAALKLLEPNGNAPSQINAYYQRHLAKVDEENREYLERVKVLTP